MSPTSEAPPPSLTPSSSEPLSLKDRYSEIFVVTDHGETARFSVPTMVADASHNANLLNYLFTFYLHGLSLSYRDTDVALIHVINALKAFLDRPHPPSSSELRGLIDEVNNAGVIDGGFKVQHRQVSHHFLMS